MIMETLAEYGVISLQSQMCPYIKPLSPSCTDQSFPKRSSQPPSLHPINIQLDFCSDPIGKSPFPVQFHPLSRCAYHP